MSAGFTPALTCLSSKVRQIWWQTPCLLPHTPSYTQESTRSSAQSNCSAKSLAGNVTDSSLSSLSSIGGSGGRGSRGRGVQGQGVWGQGVGEGEEG